VFNMADILGLILVTFIYAMLILIVLWFSDIEKMEAIKDLFIAFLFGFAAALMAAGIESLITFFGISITSLFMVVIVGPLAEEYAKLDMSTSRYFLKKMDEPEDALIYAGSVALGFSFIENILYIISFSTQLKYIQLVDLTFQRMFLCVPVHMAATIVGITMYTYLREIYGLSNLEALILSIIPSAMLHGAFNLMAISGSTPILLMLVIISLIIIIFAWLTLRNMRESYKVPLTYRKNLYWLKYHINNW